MEGMDQSSHAHDHGGHLMHAGHDMTMNVSKIVGDLAITGFSCFAADYGHSDTGRFWVSRFRGCGGGATRRQRALKEVSPMRFDLGFTAALERMLMFSLNKFSSTHDMGSNSHHSHSLSGPGGHEGHTGHGDHGSGMSMTFHGGFMEVILFSWWNVTDVGEFIGSFFAIFIMALLYEGLKYYRKHLLWKTYAGLQYCAVSSPDKGVSNICAPDEPQVIQPMPHALERNVPTMLSAAHAWQTALHGVQVLVSYMLMLVFMTYNTWLCAAVVLGSASGYFLFGWRESVVVDFTEHCH